LPQGLCPRKRRRARVGQERIRRQSAPDGGADSPRPQGETVGRKKKPARAGSLRLLVPAT
jgi:hypothetical protein